MLHFSVATHYCRGNVAASIISLSGKHASCGMESDMDESPLSGSQIKSNCCDDVVVFYAIDDNFTPSSLFITDSYQHNFQVYNIPAELPVKFLAFNKSFYTNASPPYVLMSTNVDLSNICVFRI